MAKLTTLIKREEHRRHLMFLVAICQLRASRRQAKKTLMHRQAEQLLKESRDTVTNFQDNMPKSMTSTMIPVDYGLAHRWGGVRRAYSASIAILWKNRGRACDTQSLSARSHTIA